MKASVRALAACYGVAGGFRAFTHTFDVGAFIRTFVTGFAGQIRTFTRTVVSHAAKRPLQPLLLPI
jgi:hypothetical protein